MMGIAREVHTEFPYLPASSLRGKIRSELESSHPEAGEIFFGQKIQNGKQPTEGEVWFADATLIFFPIASLSHHLVWVTCPLWLERWNRWLPEAPLTDTIERCRTALATRSALVSFDTSELYLQTALLQQNDLEKLDTAEITKALDSLTANGSLIGQLAKKLVVLTDEDCIALVETGLQREVRVALEEKSKTVKGGSFRSEEAIPPEAVLFFPWGMKPSKDAEKTADIRQKIVEVLGDRLQFGGLESLGRGWTDLKSIKVDRPKTDRYKNEVKE